MSAPLNPASTRRNLEDSEAWLRSKPSVAVETELLDGRQLRGSDLRHGTRSPSRCRRRNRQPLEQGSPGDSAGLCGPLRRTVAQGGFRLHCRCRYGKALQPVAGSAGADRPDRSRLRAGTAGDLCGGMSVGSQGRKHVLETWSHLLARRRNASRRFPSGSRRTSPFRSISKPVTKKPAARCGSMRNPM